MTIVLCVLTMSVYAQRDDMQFEYGSYYVASFVGAVTTDGTEVSRELVGVKAHVFFHQYTTVDKMPITYWTILFTDGTVIDIEEGTLIMERDDTGMDREDPGYKAQAFSFSRLLEDDHFDGVLHVATNHAGNKLTNLEVWDYDQYELIFMKKMKNVDKYEKDQEVKFKKEFDSVIKQLNI